MPTAELHVCTRVCTAAAMRVYAYNVDQWFYRKILVCTIVLCSIICVRGRHGGTEPPCKGVSRTRVFVVAFCVVSLDSGL